MRRITALVGAAALTASLLASSWSSGLAAQGSSRSSAATVTVPYWLNLCWQPAKTKFEHLVSTFNSSHPGIKIDATCFSNASVLQPRLLAAIHQGHPPALSQTDSFAVASYVDLGAVQSLDSFIHGAQGFSASQIRDFYGPGWANGLYRGHEYSLPFNDTSVTVLWYNPKILRAAHIPYPPRTWAALAADCKKVTTGRNWCMDTTDNEEPLYEAMVRQWGGQLVNSAGNKAAFDSSAGVGALQYFVRLVKKGYIHHTNSSGTQWEQDFASGHVAFEPYSSEGYTDTQSVVGKKFQIGVAQLPCGPANCEDGNGGDNIFIFKGASAAEKQAAWTYIKWATSPQQTAWWAEQLDTAPVRRSAANHMRGYLQRFPQALPAIQELPRAYFSPNVSGWGQAQGDIDTELSKAELGQESAKQAVHNAAVKTTYDITHSG
jgi:ABC-type glycerol-3-phosphate transport system substrate-binding protein